MIKNISTPPDTWIVDQNFIISIRLKNIGRIAYSLYAKLEINMEQIIPQFSTDLYFNIIEEKEITFLLKTIRPGYLKKYIKFCLSYRDENNDFERVIPINAETNFIVPSALIKENESILNSKALITKYQQLNTRFEEIEHIKEIINSIQINPNGTIASVRMVLESFINKIYLNHIGKDVRINLNSKINYLRDKNIINNKLCGWINTINTVRILANTIIHPKQDIIIKATEDDALVIVNILLNILTEFLDQNLI